MVTEKRTSPTTRLPVFAISCWVLGVMVLAQLWVAGLAMATRLEESKVARVVIKEVPKVVVVRLPAVARDDEEEKSAVVSRPPLPPPTSAEALPTPTPITAPAVEDPRSERMLKEARQARVAGDMGRAVMKLEEALSQSPDDASVQYELGLVHEQMGVFDTAASHYQKVLEMGIAGAGSLYESAAGKLRDGFEQPAPPLGKLSLGRPRIFNDPEHEDGQQVILSIPVQKAPGEEIEVADLAVAVSFFNRTSKGEIIPLEEKSWVTEKWVTLPFDWNGGEETLRMTYLIPNQDIQTRHLFGGRSYYGQVVTLLYKGEVLDVQAWPRDLAAKVTREAATGPGETMLPEFQEFLPPEFDPNLPLLPPLPSNER